MVVEEGKNILANIQTTISPQVVKGVNLLEKSYDWLKTSKFGKLVGGVFK